LAVRCSTGSVELSCVELSCVAINTPLDALTCDAFRGEFNSSPVK